MKRMRVGAVLLLGSALVLSWLVAWVFTGIEAPRDVEAAFDGAGFNTHRATVSIAPSLASEQPDVLVIVEPPVLHEAEQLLIESFVARGGHVWWLAERPGHALPPAWRVATLPGRLVSPEGASPVVKNAGSHGGSAVPGVLALDLRGAAYESLLVADSAFRDTNGNGQLDGGEPSGPFVVAAALDNGGRLVVAATLSPGELVPLLIEIEGLGAGAHVTLFDGRSGGEVWRIPRSLLAVLALPLASDIARGILVLASAAVAFLLLVPKVARAHPVESRFRQLVDEERQRAASASRARENQSEGEVS